MKRKKRKQAIYLRNRNFVKKYLMTHPCIDCGNTDIRVLEFDHVRGIKNYTVSNMQYRSISSIKHEIEKCEVRCANCHKIKTDKERILGKAKHTGEKGDGFYAKPWKRSKIKEIVTTLFEMYGVLSRKRIFELFEPYIFSARSIDRVLADMIKIDILKRKRNGMEVYFFRNFKKYDHKK